MSDFGSHVTVYRSDGKPSSAVDEQRIVSAAKSLQFASSDRIGPYDEFDLRIGSACCVDGVLGVSIGLTGYFFDDDEGNDGLDPDVIIARESDLCERFADDLSQKLNGDFRVSAYTGYW